MSKEKLGNPSDIEVRRKQVLHDAYKEVDASILKTQYRTVGIEVLAGMTDEASRLQLAAMGIGPLPQQEQARSNSPEQAAVSGHTAINAAVEMQGDMSNV